MAKKGKSRGSRRKKRSLKKDKYVTELLIGEGDDEERVELRDDASRSFTRSIKTIMKEKGLSEEEAGNYVMEQGLRSIADDRRRQGLGLNTAVLTGTDNAAAMSPELLDSYVADLDGAQSELIRRDMRRPAGLDMAVSSAMDHVGQRRIAINPSQWKDEDNGPPMTEEQARATASEQSPEQLAANQARYARFTRFLRDVSTTRALNGTAKLYLKLLGTFKISQELGVVHAVRGKWLERFQGARVFDVSVQEVGKLLYYSHKQLCRMAEMDDSRAWFTNVPNNKLLIVEELTDQLGFPDLLPYPKVFIGFGDQGIHMGDDIFLKGIFYSTDEERIAGIASVDSSDYGPGWDYMPIPVHNRESGYADTGVAVLSWAAVALIDAINQHRTLILEAPVRIRKREKLKVEKIFKAADLHLTPKLFYTANLRSRLFLSAVKRLEPVKIARRAAAYRTDRRAHEKCRIQRGTLPRTASEHATFQKHKKKLIKRQNV